MPTIEIPEFRGYNTIYPVLLLNSIMSSEFSLIALNFAANLVNRVGGGVSPAVLPHHRTNGSVYGGSRYALKPVVLGLKRYQTKVLEVGIRKYTVHDVCPGVPPWAALVSCQSP